MSSIDKDGLDRMLKGLVKDAVNSTVTSTLPRLDEAYRHEPKPFKQVSELVSQKTKNAHMDLYKGYVESLNKTSAELDTVNRTDPNPRHSEYRSLKLDEVFNLNAAWLHELYFANCFDPHSEIVMDSMAFLRIERDFGSFEDWQRDFMACALSSQNGWAVMGYHMFLRKFVNMMIDGHAGNVPVGFYPVIVVDMWEHSYYRDYLNDKKSYLISQMREFNWNVIEERVKKADALGGVVK
jgi:superoxide dismutase, Fe-Mn family